MAIHSLYPSSQFKINLSGAGNADYVLLQVEPNLEIAFIQIYNQTINFLLCT